MARLDHKRLKMSQLYEAELKFHKAIIEQKEKRIEEVKRATWQALRMMENPKLCQLVSRQLKFEDQEYTSEQYFEELKQEHGIELTGKEMEELAVLDYTLCPQTTGELYRAVRAAEQ